MAVYYSMHSGDGAYYETLRDQVPRIDDAGSQAQSWYPRPESTPSQALFPACGRSAPRVRRVISTIAVAVQQAHRTVDLLECLNHVTLSMEATPGGRERPN